MNKQKQSKKVRGKRSPSQFEKLRKMGKFIDENVAIIMIGNLIFIFIAVMIAIVLALFGVLSEQEFKIMLLMAALPMHFTFLFDIIYMIFF